ncbi:NAD-dependent epimerase/dehydratase family protein [Goodfellowiella coeruleoviolacea]|uniref:Nucleoside-diphosphate-sugar epimerase n=1 Tax=Goodfellowiella coeruleoviolacea TaxID=334858 RepID=A0AAE3GB22_9PSEU|nr:NAD-dependent epimerase/dehydratase family protein [Goodfellowiella coeruleoviolacea]MCP2164124.1 Nucleoside-diphosphate-sugar epimerase [Goodfellowiella coeruleoviolacea]
MKVVVTGATGSIGTAFVRLARALPWQVVGLARRTPTADTGEHAGVSWVSCELGAPDAEDRLRAVFADAAAVVHLAWAIQPRRGDPPMRRTNIRGTRQVLHAAALAGVPHVVCASSVAAYTPGNRWQRVDENWPLGGIPDSAYSRGKAELEQLLDGFALAHPRVRLARIRPAAVVQHDAGGQILRWTLSPLVPPGLVGRSWLPVPVWPGLRAQIVHADDVAEALRLIVANRVAGQFNLAAEPVLGADQLARLLGGFPVPLPRAVWAALAWPSWRVGVQPAHPGWLALADRACLVTTSRAREVLDWRPRHDAVRALADLVAGMARGAGTATGALAPLDHTGLTERVRGMRLGRPSHQSQR